MYERLLAEIRRLIDYEQVFAEFVEMRGSGAERTAKCFFHEDDNPSMSVNVVEGLFFCHNPECGARGDFIEFYQRVRSLKFSEAVLELARRVGVNAEDFQSRVEPPTAEQQEALLRSYRPAQATPTPEQDQERTIDEAIVISAHQRLHATPSLMEYLEAKRGLTIDTVDRYQLGHDGMRYYIPVRNAEGQCVNIRRYKPNASRSQDKMISWRTGFGAARLFPVESLVGATTVVLLEGEMDCLLGLQGGLAAITTTGGAGTWRDAWNVLFRGLDVVICYDVDEAGRVGSRHIAQQLLSVARSVKVVNLPLTEPVGADYTDFVVGHGHSVEDFLRLVAETPIYVPSAVPEQQRERSLEDPTDVHLSQASKADYYNRPVRFPAMVSGKTTSPYLVPKEVRLSCCMPGITMCSRCPVSRSAGALLHTIEYQSDNEVLQYVGVMEEKLRKQLKAKVGIPSKCGYVEITVPVAQNVEEGQVIPDVVRTDEEAPYVTRRVFFIGHGLQANRTYLMTGVTVPDPKTQLATHVIHTAVPSQSNIDAFRLTEDVVQRLRIFSPPADDVPALWSHLDTIYADLERVTRIYQRRDLMLVVDLIFHSILRFKFQGELLVRGWTEALVLGDTRTGKTTIVQRLLDHYGAGEFSSGENTSIAGLIGGLHQIGNSWALQWGRIPLNDRRLIVIDEAGNLPPEQIARMSSMRSSGIAEVIKVHTERTNSRTRQLWISNPRGQRPLSSYSQGVLAVKELIGAPEDIARFDMVVTAASDDVALDVINAPRIQEEPEQFTDDLCHQRVMWAWSRTAEQVVWAEGSEAAILESATEHGMRYRYATEVPLVEPNEQRVKLARLAVAAAATFFSASADGQEIIVRPSHVEFATEFLDRLYAKPSLSFEEYAGAQRRRYELTARDSVVAVLQRNTGSYTALMEQEQFTQRDLSEILNVSERDELRIAVTSLREAGFLRRVGSSFYVKTPAAIRFLRQRSNGNHAHELAIDRMVEEHLTREAVITPEPDLGLTDEQIPF